ncbi:MAG: DUF4296 domain-containing protein [Daejeonella sp.]
MKQLYLVIILFLLISSCQDEKLPKGILARPKMVSVLTDIQLVDSYVNQIPYNDTLATLQSTEYYNAIYRKYKISRKDFDKSLQYYSKQPKVLDSMYSQVLTNLNKAEKKVGKSLKKVNDLPE